MPVARFKGVFCCSSEDKNFPASNLLKDANKKWKCEKVGLNSALVTLQFEKPTKITGIDIGNENSAFVEVLVGKNGWSDDRFKNILLTSSFMAPLESRNSENPNRVRCFADDKLSDDVRSEKWDLIKLVCTQPFTKHVQYGLAFVKVHTTDDTIEESPTKAAKEKQTCDKVLGLPQTSVFSQFKFRDESSSDSDKESATSSVLFSKWQQNKQSTNEDVPKISAAAAIREASSSISQLKKCTKVNAKIGTPPSTSKKRISYSNRSDENDDGGSKLNTSINRNRDSLMYDEEDITTTNPKLEKLISKDKDRISREQEEQLAKKKGKIKHNDSRSKERNDRQSRDSSREERSKKKIEGSATKFKAFLDPDDDLSVSDSNDDKIIPDKSPARDSQSSSSENKGATPNIKQNTLKRRSPSTDSVNHSPLKRVKPAEIEQQKPKVYKPFGKMLEGVVFVISGIQNPERADIREKGLKMGAKYKPDWEDSCTHLICAFQNTPKYKQVQGHGKIVKRNWIVECFQQKKRLPWRRYALDPNESKQDESEDEIHDLATKPREATTSKPTTNESNKAENVLGMYDLKIPDVTVCDSDNESDLGESQPTINSQKNDNVHNDDVYDMDTDEEVKLKCSDVNSEIKPE